MDLFLLDSLAARFKIRLATALTLARTDRFVQELEPAAGEEADVFADLARSFKAWRRALRAGDADAALDAMEAAWSHLEACRRRVAERDAVIQAFRVRWAGENAALSYPTIDSLARYYRLLPCTTTSQSKYEYILTRRLAGPLGPDRWLPPTQTLLDAVIALETAWGASPVTVGDDEAADTLRAIRAFGEEATEQEDAASFIAGALLRRYGAFKASLREKLFDPRLSVTVVETNVKVLNVLNQLVADAGGRPLRGTVPVRRAILPASLRGGRSEESPLASLSEPVLPGAPSAESEEPAPFIRSARPRTDDSDDARSRPHFKTSEIDVSGLDLVIRRPPAPPEPPPSEPADQRAASGPGVSAGEATGSPAVSAGSEEALAHSRHSDLTTGEVDLSGLEFVRRLRHPRPEPAAAAGEAPSPEETAEPVSPDSKEGPEPPSAVEQATSVEGEPMDEGEGQEDALEVVQEAEQRPSPRAAELAKIEANRELIERYMTRPRSPEVWRLNLDSFLGGPITEYAEAQGYSDDRRRAFELILASDDLICLRETQEGAPTAEHRSRVKELGQAMLRLQTSLRRAASIEEDRGEQEPLLYVSDHLLWERLRLGASLKRNPVLKRPPLMPRATRAVDSDRRRARLLRRHRRILYWVVGSAVTVTVVIGMMGAAAPRTPIDPEVRSLRLQDLPEPQVFVDARAFRNRLFITADLSWSRLGREERQAIVRSIGAFAAERGLDTVSVVGPKGEALASFKDNEVILDSDLVEIPREAR